MNTYIKNRGQGVALFYTLFLSLLFLLPQKAIAVVETVHYSMNPEDVVCTPQLYENGTPYFSVEWKGHGYQEYAQNTSNYLNEYIYYLVPKNTNNFRVSVVATPGHTVCHNLSDMEIPTKYTPPRYPELEDFNMEEIDPSFLASSTGIKADVESDGFIFGDWHIVRVKVCPLKYSSDPQKSLRIEPELDITLEYDECDIENIKESIIQPGYVSSEITEVLSSIEFINRKTANDLIMNHISKTFFYQSTPIDKYYIIVPESLEDSVQDLAIWKSQKGYDVIVKTVEDILSDPMYKVGGKSAITGEEIVDEASSLRTYLQQQFKMNGVFYCFLIGDWRTSMPIRKYADASESTIQYNFNCDDFTPSDDYFSDLTSHITYDTIKSDTGALAANLNRDFYPDIFVGRLLCSTDQEVRNYFEKLRIYESFPGKGDDDYLTTAMYFENNPRWKVDKTDLCSLVGLSVESMEELDIFSNIIYARDIDETQGYTSTSMPMLGKDIIRYMRRTGYNSWCGHGHPVGILTSGGYNFIIPQNSYTRGVDGQVSRRESEEDVDNGLDLIDNVNYPAITYSVGCSIAPFDRFEEGEYIYDIPYNMAGAYTVSGLNGGVAIIANSRDAGVYNGMALQYAFSKQVKITPKLGIARGISKLFCQASKVSTLPKLQATKKMSNLIGDPELAMWLNKPNKFCMAEDSGHILNIKNIDNNGAQYTVYDGNTWVYRFISDGTPDPSLGTYESYMPLISVWKQGYLPKLTLYAREGNFTNVKKKYFAQDAIFGSADTSKQCVVGKDASVEIDVMTAIEINDGFHAGNGGKVDIICHDNITASGELVKAGGEVHLRGEKIVLEAGFKVESGGLINLSTF